MGTSSAATGTGVAVQDDEVVESVLGRIAEDVGMIVDRELRVGEVRVERMRQRVAGRGQVHISFKLVVKAKDEVSYGCLLMPLPEALSLASYLMMVPDEAVAANRESTELDRSTKDALLEIGNFVAGAADAAVRGWFEEGYSVRSEGCQGVRADVRPAFPYEEGDELVVGRAEASVGEFPPFELTLMLPVLF